MYCRNCGAYVPGNEALCEACRMELVIQQPREVQMDLSAEGRGIAIASIIVGFVGGFLGGLITMVTAMLEAVPVAILMGLVTVGCLVFGIIGGAKGISAFRYAGRMNARRPIASLICGIIGLATSCFFLLYWFIMLFAVGAAFSMYI